jgi:sigma-B regulation protein RsbU (phosphoserine phosphatase)
VARVLQESLLPPRLPETEGLDLATRYAPGEGMVGGDFYDVFEIGRGAYGAAIGDVQGKDARAAGMTNVVRHSLRSSAQTRDPGAALAIVNRIVLQEQEPSDPRFSSATLARLDRDGDGFALRLSSAGHPPSLVVRAAGTVEECHAPGTLLGITDEPELAVAGTRLGARRRARPLHRRADRGALGRDRDPRRGARSRAARGRGRHRGDGGPPRLAAARAGGGL